MATAKRATTRTKNTRTLHSPVNRKRSLAAKKGAITRAFNHKVATRRQLRAPHKIFAAGAIGIVLVFTFLGIRSQLETFAASTNTGSFVGLDGKCLDNSGSRLAYNNRIQLYKCNGTIAQKWVLTSSGSLRANNGSSYCLDVPGNSKAEYTYLRLWKCNDSAAQHFTLTSGGIMSKTTQFAATVRYAETSNGTKIWMKAFHGSSSQQWIFSGSTASVGVPTTGRPVTVTVVTGGSAGSATGSNGGPTGGSSLNGSAYGTAEHPFSARSPWNTLLPSNPTIDPNSSAINTNVLNNNSLVLNMILYSYGQPVYISTANTPYITLGGRSQHFLMPMDQSWTPNTGADGKINVFDTKTGYSYELDQFSQSARTAYWGVKHNFVTGLADGYPSGGELPGPTGSGMSQLAGMVRISDIRSGSIDHALSFITSQPQQGAFRYPASQTDGKRTDANGIQEGMRIQLDPSLNIDSIPGITAGEKMVAKALQKYGAYCTDTGAGNNMAAGFYAEKPTTTADPYPGVGWSQDWAQLPHIPRDKIRVIAASVTPRP